MFCNNCGQPAEEGTKFCQSCGNLLNPDQGNQPVQPQQQQPVQPQYQQPQYQQPPVYMAKPPINQQYNNYQTPNYPNNQKKKSGASKAILIVCIVLFLGGAFFFTASLMGWFTKKDDKKFYFKQDKPTVEATATIGSQGGVLMLPDNSRLAGSSVRINSATLSEDTNVTIGTVTGSYSTAPESISDTAFYLDLGGNKNIAQPLEITFKYATTEADKERVPVGLYIDDDGNILPVTTKSIDKENGTFTIFTFHASIYTFYFLDEIVDYIASEKTSFLPSADGFKEKNEGSTIFSSGECYGMSTFSKWYFMNIKEGSDGFFAKFQSPEMGTSPSGDVITPQDVIATKAFQYTTRQSSILWTTERRFSSFITVDDSGNEVYTIDNSVAVRSIMESISFWDEPAEVGIYGTAGHSVLAYKYTKTDTKITIYIYDPNFPGDDTQTIVYDVATKAISTPSYPAGFLDKSLTTTGYGTFSSVSEYQNILADANNDFANTEAKVVILSPEDGVELDTGTCFISGTVDTLQVMGEQIGDTVEIISDTGEIFKQTLVKNSSDPSSFSVEVPLKNGENRFLVNVIYYDEDGNEHFLSTDFYGWLTINSTVPQNVINVTLTWDAEPDVDLYVTDPTGDTSYYSDKLTADGGELDIDDRSSYGPEHWNLTTEDTIRWNEAYIIRVHYYTGGGPTQYTVKVTVNEGTSSEITEIYTGVISSYNSSNAYTDSVGGDWADICTVVPTR